MTSVLYFVLDLLVFRIHPHIHCTLSFLLSVESSETFPDRKASEMSRLCMC